MSSLIGELFRIVRRTAESPTRKREVVRQQESRPVVDRCFAGCHAEAVRVLDETPLAKGIRYALNRALRSNDFSRTRGYPRNNGSENALRREAVGRYYRRCLLNAYLFLGQERAHRRDRARGILFHRNVPQPVEYHELRAGDGGVEPLCVLRQDPAIAPTPQDQRRHM